MNCPISPFNVVFVRALVSFNCEYVHVTLSTINKLTSKNWKKRKRLRNLKVPELKRELEQRDKELSGNKDELQERLV